MLTTRKSCEWPRCLKGWLRIAGQGRFPEGSERVCKVGPAASFPSSYLSTSRRNVEMSWGGKWKIIDNSFEISLIPLFKKFGKNQIRKIKGQACQLAPPKSLSPLQEHAEEKNASMFPNYCALHFRVKRLWRPALALNLLKRKGESKEDGICRM